jgi:hypothetical protein
MRLTNINFRYWLAFVILTISFSQCRDDENKPKVIPEVSTNPVTDVTTTSAKSGGEITSDGNDKIIASGVVYSKTNAIPTLENDSKTNDQVLDGIFITDLENLSSGATYHVRAYVTNSVGTGYGDVVDFVTGNAAPVATNVVINGDVKIHSVFTASYTYGDNEGDAESGTTFQWYIATIADGSDEVAITDATSLTYTALPTDEFKYVRVAVTPNAATGTVPGLEVKSPFIGPLPQAPETVTFTYNGESVTYEVLISPVTGRKWFDRNLGAKRAAAAYDDYLAYGDLFQWGRPADGHQLITWTGSTVGTPVNGTTETQFTTDTPENSLFYSALTVYDWRNPENDDLWQGVDGVNNPCPDGWKIPTIEEWQNENIVYSDDAYNNLKITAPGFRRGDNGGGPVYTSADANYWSSTITPYYFQGNFVYNNADAFEIRKRTSEAVGVRSERRTQGLSCRCIKLN